MSERLIALFTSLQQDHPVLSHWKLGWDNAKRRAGVCFPSRKLIRLSRHHILLNPWAIVEDTLLHEVAHALAWEKHREKGHGRQWKRIVHSLGAKPKATGSFLLPQTNWVMVYKPPGSDKIEKVAERFRRQASIKRYSLIGRPESLGHLFYLSNAQYTQWLEQSLSFDELEFIQ